MSWTTIYDETITNYQGTGTRNLRNVIDANTASDDGTKIRILLAAGPGGDFTFQGASVGVMTTADDFDSAPTRITWDSGNNGATVSSSSTKLSDEITFSFDKTKRHGIHIYTTSQLNCGYTLTEGHGLYYNTVESDDTLTQAVSYSLVDPYTILDKVEIFVGAVVEELAGTISAQSALSGVAKRTRKVIGSFVGASSFSGVVKRERKVSGSLAGQSSLSAILRNIALFQGAITGQASLTAGLKRLRVLTGSMDAQGSLNGVLKRGRTLSALLEAQSALEAGLKRNRGFSGLIEAVTSLTGRLYGAPDYTMAVAEAIGVREIKLRSKREYSEGEDIINRILSSIWEDIDKKETTWSETKKLQKDE